jgi:hypothetical protein
MGALAVVRAAKCMRPMCWARSGLYVRSAMSGDEDYGRAVDFLSTLAVNP